MSQEKNVLSAVLNAIAAPVTSATASSDDDNVRPSVALDAMIHG
jgi:hypothetical protein